MKKLIKPLFKKSPWRAQDYFIYLKTFRRWPDLKKPTRFSEKILCRKHYDCHVNIMYTLMADKMLVREYVEGKIGAGYLIPLIYSTSRPEDLLEIREKLINVIAKPNHGAGMVHFYDAVPSFLELSEHCRKFQKWLDLDFSEISCEYHYKNIERKILIEQRLRCDEPYLTDYKFHLFRQDNGEYWYVLQVIGNRFLGDIERTFFINTLNDPLLSECKDLLSQALTLSITLADSIDYVRIDWYIVQQSLYFGEITLTPAAGFSPGIGDALDRLMGEKWHYIKPENYDLLPITR